MKISTDIRWVKWACGYRGLQRAEWVSVYFSIGVFRVQRRAVFECPERTVFINAHACRITGWLVSI